MHPPSTSSASEPLVSVEGLVRRFGATTAVDGVDLRVDRGQVVCLLGPNGAGKSTTLTTIEGFARPDAGRVRVFGLDPERDAAEVRPRIGVMLQAGGAHLSARAGDMLTLIARCARLRTIRPGCSTCSVWPTSHALRCGDSPAVRSSG